MLNSDPSHQSPFKNRVHPVLQNSDICVKTVQSYIDSFQKDENTTFVDTLNKSMELLELRNVTLIQKLDLRTIEQIVYLIKLSMKEIRKRLVKCDNLQQNIIKKYMLKALSFTLLLCSLPAFQILAFRVVGIFFPNDLTKYMTEKEKNEYNNMNSTNIKIPDILQKRIAMLTNNAGPSFFSGCSIYFLFIEKIKKYRFYENVFREFLNEEILKSDNRLSFPVVYSLLKVLRGVC